MNYYEKIIQEKRNGTTFVNIGSKTFQYQDDSTSSIESAQREMESFYLQEINRLTDERNRITRELDSKIRRIGEDKDRSTKKLHQEYKKAYAYEKGNSKEEKDNTSLQEWSKECEEMLKKGLSDSEIFAELRKKGLDVFDAKKVLSWTKEHKSSKEENYYAKLCEKKNLTYDTEKLAKQVKTWLSTGAYDEREIADKLEKEYRMPKSVASHTLEMGKRLRAQG